MARQPASSLVRSLSHLRDVSPSKRDDVSNRHNSSRVLESPPLRPRRGVEVVVVVEAVQVVAAEVEGQEVEEEMEVELTGRVWTTPS